MRQKRTLQSFFLLCFYILFLQYSPAQINYKPLPSYEINVELFPEEKILKGTVDVTYVNNSTIATDSIFLQIYPNAYSSGNTEFGKQQLRYGHTQFYFSPPEDKGSITDLNFRINGAGIGYHYYMQDIVYLLLDEPLQPGESIRISTPFTVKIPRVFSRMGYEGGTFQISQWFPKVMKLSSEGWHKYPYLDMGEFYGDFADYRVDITLPSDFIVAATGSLQDTAEMEWYKHLSKDRNAKNPRQSEQKTLSYIAENVQDFAWFADRDFIVDYSREHIAGKDIDCWVFHRDESETIWSEAMPACVNSLKKFSEWVGPYQYPQMSIVGAHLEAGAGMEYPMVSLIGKMEDQRSLHEVIAHEVAHNWFYGMLAFNERKYPYMDEGLTSQLEQRYMKEYFDYDADSRRPVDAYPYEYEEYYYWNYLQKNYPLSINNDIGDESEMSFYLLNYNMAPNAYEFLRYYVGDNHWTGFMHSFYNKFLFSHIQPADFRQHLRENLPIETDWLVDDYLSGEKPYDYSIRDVMILSDSLQVEIKNNSGLNAPLILQQLAGDTILWEGRFSAFANDKVISVPHIHGVEKIHIYTGTLFAGYNPSRTYDMVDMKLHKKNVTLGLLIGYEPPERNTIHFYPLLGINKYDGFMVGLGAHNYTLTSHNLQFELLPFYSFKSKTATGLFNITYDIYDKKPNLNHWRLKLEGRKFSAYYNEHYDFIDSYNKIRFGLEYHIEKNVVSNYKTILSGNISNIHENYGVGENYDEKIYRREKRDYQIYSAEIDITRKHILSPASYNISFQHLGKDSRLTIDYRIKYLIRPQFSVSNRLFMGYAIMDNTDKPSLGFYLSGTPSYGNLDYSYDEFLIERRSSGSPVFQQVYERDMAFPLPVIFPLGKYAIGGNLNLNLAIGFFNIEPYFSYVLAKEYSYDKEFLYTTGVRLSLADNIIHFNFPIASSESLNAAMSLQGYKSYASKITFNIDLQRLLPSNFTKSIFGIR